MDFVFKDGFTVMGKTDSGPSGAGQNWIPALWQAVSGDFARLSPRAILDGQGAPAGIWGLMSDMDERLLPWDERGGKYLAGCEADPNADVPEGFAKWAVPAQTYLVKECTPQSYGEVFGKTMEETLPINRLSLCGAVHEHYPEPGNGGRIQLYFPIASGNRADIYRIRLRLLKFVRSRYLMDEMWNGKDELKFRRSGKTLVTFLFKEDRTSVLIIFGKEEREKFEMTRSSFSDGTRDYYDSSRTYHDGKWMFIDALSEETADELSRLILIKKKPNKKDTAAEVG